MPPQEKVFPHAASRECIRAVDAHEYERDPQGERFLPSASASRPEPRGHLPGMHADVGAHEEVVPVRACEVRRARKADCGRNRHEPRHQHAARRHEQRAHANPRVHEQLHDAVWRIRSLAERRAPASVERDMRRPQHEQHHAQNLMHFVARKKHRAAHERDRKNRHHNVERHADSLCFCHIVVSFQYVAVALRE